MRIVWKRQIMHLDDGSIILTDSNGFNKDPHLFANIKNMPSGKPISLAAAYDLYWHEITTIIHDENNPYKAAEITNNGWIKFISSLGYQIILTGNEFEIIEHSA